MKRLFIVALWLIAALSTAPAFAHPQPVQKDMPGPYRNYFAEGPSPRTTADIDAKLEAYWKSLFEGDENQRIFYAGAPNANGNTAYILDTGNDDVRSEGMSYGLMIAVQMNKKAEFDALWNWAYTHMRYASGPRQGYFRWQCTRDGCPRDAVAASDGEEYIVMALFFAAHRWGKGAGIYDYETEANAILDAMLHKEDMNGGVVDNATNMFNRKEKQVVFVPHGDSAGFTDPSYHLPAFYELWGRWARGWNGQQAEDRAFWLEAAKTSRALFDKAAHPITGLTPNYSEFDGRPKPIDGHGDFRFDAHRSAVNWSVDYAWWGEDAQAPVRSERLLRFFESRGMSTYEAEFTLDGKPLTQSRSSGLIASNAVMALSTPWPRTEKFVDALWELEPPSGKWRYYSGLLQYMAMLHVSGRFQAW